MSFNDENESFNWDEVDAGCTSRDSVSLDALDDTQELEEFNELYADDNEGVMGVGPISADAVEPGRLGEKKSWCGEEVADLAESMAVFNAEIHSSSEPIEQGNIDQILHRVEFHIGSCSISRGNLNILKEGDLVKLNSNYYKSVSVRVGEIEIGVGEVVKVDDDLAIRIKQIRKR